MRLTLRKYEHPSGVGYRAPDSVDDAAKLVAFLQRVFGATGDFRTDTPSVVKIGDSLVMVSASGQRDLIPAFLYVYVDDVDEPTSAR